MTETAQIEPEEVTAEDRALVTTGVTGRLADDIVAHVTDTGLYPEPRALIARYTDRGWDQGVVQQIIDILWHLRRIELVGVAWWADNPDNPDTRGHVTVVRPPQTGDQ